MPRGKHTKTGYSWGVPDRDKAQIKIPKEIKHEVEEYAHKLWEEHKQKEHEQSVSKDKKDEDNK